MAALTGVRNTLHLGDSPMNHLRKVPVKANTVIYAGAAVVIDAGYLAPARTATGLLSAGVAQKTFNNTGGAAGAIIGECRVGVFGFANSGGGDLIAQADVGKVCYFVDDQTVALTDGTGTRSAAGRIQQLEGGQVFVQVGVLV